MTNKIVDYPPAGRGPFAVRLLDVKPSDTILDVGCFNGHLERHLLKGRCKKYFGVDMNAEAIRFAKQFPDGDCFLEAPSENLPFENEAFDKILCLDTFEHVADEAKTISEIRRVLKAGGVLVLSVPHDFLNFLDPDELTRGLRNFVRKYIRKRPLLDHPKHRHYSEAQLRALLEGFEITYVHKSGTPVFWFLTMFYTALGLPERLTAPLRRITDPIDNIEYALRLPTGFNIMVKAVKTATP